MTGPAVRFAHAWLSVYTRGVIPEVGDERRAELESDLWEHINDAALAGEPRAQTALAVMGRVVRGVPADLTWRHHHRATRPARARRRERRAPMEELHAGVPRRRIHARCVILGHKWVRLGGEDHVTRNLRCRRCAKVLEDRGTINIPPLIG